MLRTPTASVNPLGKLQLTEDGKLKHFLTPEGLDRATLTHILDTADSFISVGDKPIKKAPVLRGKTVANLFFENSTRTRTTFELAASRLSADILNLNIATSSATKGESILDTLRNLQAMQCDMFVVRHSDSGAAHFIAQHVAPHISVINAGDGRHAHPTQALLDVYTIRQKKGAFENLTFAIVGDVLHSRVARSEIHALKALGAGEVRVIGPKTLLPDHFEDLGVTLYRDINRGLKDVDVVMMLRLQRERMGSALLPSASEYYRHYGLSQERLALIKPDAIIMHPGPTNRGVEIEGIVADGDQSVILDQVTNGIAVRMAVMAITTSTINTQRQSGDNS